MPDCPMKHILFFFIAWVFVGCNGHTDTIATSRIDSFPINDSLHLTSWNLTNELDLPTRIYCYDSIIALRNTKGDQQVVLLSAASGKIKKKIIKTGRGPGELLAAWHLTSMDTKGNFYVFDVTTKELMRVNLDSTLSGKQIVHPKMDLAEALKNNLSVELLDDTTFVASGYFDNFRIRKFNRTGSRSTEMGINPAVAIKPNSDTSKFDMLLNEYYQGIIKRSPDGSKYALGCLRSDQIEVFDKNSDRQKRFIIGPIYQEPTYNVLEGGSMSLNPDIAIDAYYTIAVTDKYILGLFFGKTLSSTPDSGYAQTVHVFDWDGKPIARYFLDQPCISMDIDPRTNRLYTLSFHPVPEIHYVDLDLP